MMRMKTGRRIGGAIGVGSGFGIAMAALFLAFLRVTGFAPSPASKVPALCVAFFLPILVDRIPMTKDMRRIVFPAMFLVSMLCVRLYAGRVVVSSASRIDPIMQAAWLLHGAALAGMLFVFWKERRKRGK